MKRVVLTALAATLLCSTSALAQEARERRGPPSRESSGGVVGRLSRDVATQVQAREAPARSQPAPQQQQQQAQPQSRGGFDGRRGGDSNRGSGRTYDRGSAQAPQTPLAGAAPADRNDGQRWNGQRPGGQAYQGQRRPDTDRGPDGRTVTREDRNDMRLGRYNGQNDNDRNNGGRDNGRQNDGRDWNRGGNDGRGWDRDGRGPQGRPPVVRPEDRRDRDWNRPRYDERRYPRYVTPRQRYQWRGPIYRPPVNFYSYRWQFGQSLPWNWYTPNYYINDWAFYGLPMPPIGYEWVRAGDDAILVNVFTGRIYQVVYNLFW